MTEIFIAPIWRRRKHAAGCGLTLEQMKAELLSGRDLSKKGDHKRQVEYVTRTAEKALRGF